MAKAKSKSESTSPQKPAATIRQGNLKCVIWRNEGENGPWYVADLVRTFKTESGFQDTTKVPADDLLRVAFLAQQAFGQLQLLKAQDRQSDSEDHDVSPQP
ncbi:hypothetical protein [Rubinisphaera margarita]|uniref:hypothetical protein n=1 Tax=Rubinisphaera margarita TaxID=2909586 RepID=UPI001EE8BBBD|nr:hypothetical protein [Rubinisphaera margarita]MCG6157626.1 hypothetical protein [Rubinisphaera margarita]